MELDRLVTNIFSAAYSEAKHEKHEYFTPEHVLYAGLYFDEVRELISACGGNADRLRSNIYKYLKENISMISDGEPVQSLGIQSVLSAAASHVQSCGKDVITIGDILVAIHDAEESFASYFLQLEGIKRIDILNFITHGTVKIQDDERLDSNASDEEVFDDQNFSFLKEFTTELTEKAARGEIDPLVGREDILERTLHVLCRRLKNNPVHVGDPGVGKTAITEGLARLIVEGKVPEKLKGFKIYALDMGAMIAGTKYRGDFEDRVKKVLREIKKQEKAIVYIDEIHNIIGTGSVSGGSMDASNILKPFLDRGGLRVIGSTTYDEFKKIFDKDRALSRRFQKIEISEPSIEETYNILIGIKDSYEKFHNVVYSKEALRAAVELSVKYINDKFLPDKAIDIIDEAGAFARIHNDKDDERIEITEREVEKIVSFIGKIPEQNVSVNEVEMLKNLEQNIKKQIFGQHNAIDTVVRAIKRSRAGFNEGDKPVASLLFVGPTGVGKTEIAKQLALNLNIPLIRFDMSEYQEKHTVARLIGAPPGYVGFDEGGLLTDAIRKTPYCVLLLDEIEKVHPDVLNILLQIMDYATLTDNNGKKADFKNVILIMTSNAGARDIGKNMIGFGSRIVQDEAINKEVERVFSPEFRNRLDEVVVFNKMDEAMAKLISQKAMKQFADKLKNRGVNLKVTEDCYRWLSERGLSSNYGAREILRLVQQKIKPYFVDAVLFGDLSKGGTAIIDIKNDEIVIAAEECTL